MKKLAVLLLLSTLFTFPSLSRADINTDLNTAVSTLSGDFSQVVDWFNGQVAKASTFSSGGSLDRPAGVKSFPGFEIGATAVGAASTDSEAVKNLPTQAIPGNFLNLPAVFVIPGTLYHAKVGLFNVPSLGKIDLGAGFGHLSTKLPNEFDGNFTQWQVEGRLQVAPVPLPVDISLNLGVANAKGNYLAQRRYRQTTPGMVYNGIGYTQTLDSTVFVSSDWDVTSYFAKIIVSRDLLVMTPYFGLGLQTATGNVNSVVGSEGKVTLEPVSSGPAGELTRRIEVPASSKPRNFDWRLLGGIQMSVAPFVGLNLSADLGKDVYGCNLGLVLSVL